MWSLPCSALFAVLLLIHSGAVSAGAEVVRVRYPEGTLHGFLTLRSPDGALLADGDLIQTVRGSQVTSRIVFRFRDGSTHDETAVYSQRGEFRLIRDHLVQKGPAFPRPIDTTIDVATGHVTVRYVEDGKLKVEEETLELPADLANGMISTLLKNVSADAPPRSFSFVAATPKPRLVKLAISSAGKERFSTGATSRQAVHYILKVEIGGLTGVIADVLDKVPPDSHVWILPGEAPAFVRAQQPFFAEAPLWRIDLTSPRWPATPGTK